jgi:hypothetical protein
LARKTGKTKQGLPRIGKLPPRYRFFLNPYTEYRFSSCPRCHAKMHQRKLPLVIHIDPLHLIALNKTCRYCPGCEVLIVHQNELESILAAMFAERWPHDLGNAYLVLGTMERADWKEGMRVEPSPADAFARMHDFREHLNFVVQPANWYPAEPPRPHT